MKYCLNLFIKSHNYFRDTEAEALKDLLSLIEAPDKATTTASQEKQPTKAKRLDPFS